MVLYQIKKLLNIKGSSYQNQRQPTEYQLFIKRFNIQNI
jgi:hypothetical protein